MPQGTTRPRSHPWHRRSPLPSVPFPIPAFSTDPLAPPHPPASCLLDNTLWLVCPLRTPGAPISGSHAVILRLYPVVWLPARILNYLNCPLTRVRSMMILPMMSRLLQLSVGWLSFPNTIHCSSNISPQYIASLGSVHLGSQCSLYPLKSPLGTVPPPPSRITLCQFSPLAGLTPGSPCLWC